MYSNNGVLNDAVEVLAEFKDVEWPPKQKEIDEILKVPSWLENGDERSDGESSSVENRGDKNNISPDRQLSNLADVAQKKDEGSVPEEAVVDTDDVKELEAEVENTHISKEGKEVLEKIEQEEEAAGKLEADKSSEEEKDVKELEEELENTHISEEGKEVIEKLEQEEEAGDSEAQKDIDEDGEKKADKRIEAIVDNEKPMQTPQSPVPPSKKNINASKAKQSSKQTPSVDEAAMEPMHPAVITTLHALCMVISSESKTHKMIETSLECITILTNGRYVSGVAGGRMKLEVQRKMSKDLSNEKEGEGDSADDNNTPGSPSSPVKVYGAHNGIQLTTSKGHDGRDGGLSFLGYVVESITRASDSSSEAVQGCMAKALLSIMTCPKCGVHEAAMLQAVRSTFHVYLVGKSVSGKDLAKRTLVDMLKCVFMRMEAYDIISKDNNVGSSSCIDQSKSGDESVGTATTAATSNADDPSTSVGAFASQYHTDSYLLFRALCKLSSKTLPGDENVGMVPPTGIGSSAMMQGMSATFFSSTPTVDPLALNSKILSLELILAVFEHCGDAFQNGEKFVYAVQSYLCVSLLKNCMSNHTVVAHLSLKIFLLLVSEVCTFPAQLSTLS